MKICGVISEIDIKKVIRLRLAVADGFINAMEIKGFLLIQIEIKYQRFEYCITKKKKQSTFNLYNTNEP